jgi:transposase
MKMKYVGIDVSRDHLDFALVDGEGTHEVSAQVRNEAKAITALVRSWMKKNGLDPAASLFCLEPTGHYSHLLLTVLVGPERARVAGAPHGHQAGHGHRAGQERQG